MTNSHPRRRARRRRCSPWPRRAAAAAPAAARAAAAAAERDRARRSRGEGGAPPRLAVPDFIALSTDAETVGDREDDRPGALGRPELRARVRADPARHLRDDSARRRRSTDVPFDRWRELNADGVVVGTVQKTGTGVTRRGAAVQRAHAGSRRSRKEYSGSAANPRLYAHTIPTRSTSSSARCAASRGPS